MEYQKKGENFALHVECIRNAKYDMCICKHIFVVVGRDECIIEEKDFFCCVHPFSRIIEYKESVFEYCI